MGDAMPFAAGGQPYYIVAPRYIRTSAGVKALYLLCHSLNRAGQEAFMVVYPDRPNPDRTKLDLLIPRLSSEQMQKHVKAGVSPIIVYPETIGGNPLRGRSIVRYVLNFPGLLAGDRVYQKNEMVFGYSSVLAEAGGAPGRVLFIPTSDTKLFSPGPPQTRLGSCFYAMKYQLVHQGALFPVAVSRSHATGRIRSSRRRLRLCFAGPSCFTPMKIPRWPRKPLCASARRCFCPIPG